MIAGTPDYITLTQQVEALSPCAQSPVHGIWHWRHVALIGHRLLMTTDGADAHVVFLFALFHDACRENDWHDPQHGARGAVLAQQLHGAYFALTSTQLSLLVVACENHTTGSLAENPTIAVCWDADRLNLWRLGRRPDPRYLSTSEARKAETIAWARELLHHRPSWGDVIEQYKLFFNSPSHLS